MAYKGKLLGDKGYVGSAQSDNLRIIEWFTDGKGNTFINPDKQGFVAIIPNGTNNTYSFEYQDTRAVGLDDAGYKIKVTVEGLADPKLSAKVESVKIKKSFLGGNNTSVVEPVCNVKPLTSQIR